MPGIIRDGSEWLRIPVPQIIDDETWNAAQRQMVLNAQRSGRNNKRHKYLLRGMIKCPRCGGSYSGAVSHGVRRYRCSATDRKVSSTGRVCSPGSFKADPVETLVWDAISDALQSPELLKTQFQSQLEDLSSEDRLVAGRGDLQTRLNVGG